MKNDFLKLAVAIFICVVLPLGGYIGYQKYQDYKCEKFADKTNLDSLNQWHSFRGREHGTDLSCGPSFPSLSSQECADIVTYLMVMSMINDALRYSDVDSTYANLLTPDSLYPGIYR